MAEPAEPTYEPMDYAKVFGDLHEQLFARLTYLYSLVRPYTRVDFEDIGVDREVDAIWSVIGGIEDLTEERRDG